MVKSKRNKIVSLTQVKKKGKDHKGQQIEEVAKLLSEYKKIFVMDIEIVKAKDIMDLRNALKPDCRIFSGKNTLVSQAIKRHRQSTQSKKDFKEFENQLKNKNALIFTNQHKDEVIEKIESHNGELRARLKGYADFATNSNVVTFEKY